MSKVGEYYREREEMGLVEDLDFDPYSVSNCCNALPLIESNICSECRKHAEFEKEGKRCQG